MLAKRKTDITGGFSYGHLSWPKDSDPRFATEQAALNAAEKASRESATNDVYGVWDDESGELLHIVYQDIVYSP